MKIAMMAIMLLGMDVMFYAKLKQAGNAPNIVLLKHLSALKSVEMDELCINRCSDLKTLFVMMETQVEEMDVMTSASQSLALLVQAVTQLGTILVMKLVEMVETLVIYLVMMAMIEQVMDVITLLVFGVEDFHAH